MALSEQLIRRARRLESAALETLHTHFYPEVYRYVSFRLDADEGSEAVAAAVFLELVQALRRKKFTRLTLRRWLYETAAAMVLEVLRRQTPEALSRRGPLTPETWNEAGERSHLRSLLRHLSPEQQHFLALRFAEDRGLEDAASLLGLSLPAARELQFQAVAAYKELLIDQRL